MAKDSGIQALVESVREELADIARQATGYVGASGYQRLRHWRMALISRACSYQMSFAKAPKPGCPTSKSSSLMRRAPVWCWTMASSQRRA